MDELMELLAERPAVAARWIRQSITDYEKNRDRVQLFLDRAGPSEVSALIDSRIAIDEWGDAILAVMAEIEHASTET